MKTSFPLVQAANSGFVDTAGFLALQGLFTAHVTGNFVTLGASLVFGTSGAVPKLLALPTFCVVVLLVRLLRYRLIDSHQPVLQTLLLIKLGLLCIGAALAIHFGPFTNGDSAEALVTGLTLVTAMAIQNAAHRVHLAAAPPTTMMTGTTTQIMLDIADLIHRDPVIDRIAVRVRLVRYLSTVLCFALGCATGALGYAFGNVWCFLAPPLLALLAYVLSPRDESLEAKPAGSH